VAERGFLRRIDRLDRKFSAGLERGPLPDAVRLAAHHYSDLGVVIGWVVDRAIKHLVGRERPPAPLVEKADKRDSPSFPSSHSTTAFAMAQAYWPLLPQLPLYTIAATQAASRLVANVHYPSDVLAGIGLGLLAGRSRPG
jgi:membrane-associated phospholipid phosphatase